MIAIANALLPVTPYSASHHLSNRCIRQLGFQLKIKNKRISALFGGRWGFVVVVVVVVVVVR